MRSETLVDTYSTRIIRQGDRVLHKESQHFSWAWGQGCHGEGIAFTVTYKPTWKLQETRRTEDRTYFWIWLSCNAWLRLHDCTGMFESLEVNLTSTYSTADCTHLFYNNELVSKVYKVSTCIYMQQSNRKYIYAYLMKTIPDRCLLPAPIQRHAARVRSQAVYFCDTVHSTTYQAIILLWDVWVHMSYVIASSTTWF